jgi:hypothetical protein
MTTAWRVQRILQEHVGRRELVHSFDVVRVAPEFREPGLQYLYSAVTLIVSVRLDNLWEAPDR